MGAARGKRKRSRAADSGKIYVVLLRFAAPRKESHGREQHRRKEPDLLLAGTRSARGRRRSLWRDPFRRESPPQRSGQLLAPRRRPLDRRASGLPDRRPVLLHHERAHWIAKEWLSQILYAGAHALGGWAGMAILAAAAIALAFVFLTRFLTRRARAPAGDRACRRGLRHPCPARPGATARARLAGDGCLRRRTRPRGRPEPAALVVAATPHGALGQPPWRLHARDSSHRRRRP